jgi:hypothetical protein
LVNITYEIYECKLAGRGLLVAQQAGMALIWLPFSELFVPRSKLLKFIDNHPMNYASGDKEKVGKYNL